MIVPWVIMLIIEIFQGGLYVFCYAAIEKATGDAARVVMLGGLSSPASTADGFRTSVLCSRLLAGLSCTNVVTSLQATTLSGTGGGYSSFVSADETSLIAVPMSTTQSSYCPGAASTYQYFQAFYAVPVFSPIWIALGGTTKWNGSTVIFVRAAAAFRNEPFTTTPVTVGC